MRKLLLTIFFITSFFFLLPRGYAQTNQTVANGAATAPENFAGSCLYNWVNNNPSIGLPASGIGNISSFTAINTGSSPVKATITAMPMSEGFAYIENSGEGTISVINVATNTVVSKITPPSDAASICISPDGSKAYVGCSDGVSTIAVVNTNTNTITRVIPVSNAGESTGVVVSPDDATIYVANYVTGTVSVVNQVLGTVVAVIPVGPNPYGIAISPDGSKVYVAYAFGNSISVINTATNTITTNVTTGIETSAVAVSPDGSKVYVSVTNSNHVAVINAVTNNIITVIPTAETPGIIGLSPDGTRAYVATGANHVSVINIATNSVINSIEVGEAPTGVCVSPDGHFVYTTNVESNNVSVINTSTNTVIATVAVGIGPVSLGSFVTAGAGCASAPITFNITVNPPPAPLPIIITSNVSGNVIACSGAASVTPNIQQFTVSGSNLTGDVTATAPAGFELSLNNASGYSNSLILAQSNGALSNSVIYVRSAATAASGSISGNVILSSAGATDQTVAVSGTVYATPFLNTPASQTLVSGSATIPVNFAGTITTYSWVNDTPGIGLAASGTGNIPAFTAVNNTIGPVTATITVTPLNGVNCSGAPVSFTITVNPKPTSVSIMGPLTALTTVYGSPSSAESFTVSGTTITSGILITPPAGYEISNDGSTFNPTISLNITGSTAPFQVYIRLASGTPVGSYTGNVEISTGTIASATIVMPAGTVTPAALIITADNKTKPYGSVNPALTVTYNGFVNGDNAAQLTTQPIVFTTAVTKSVVGQYPITASDAGSPNYSFTYLPGILTVDPSLSFVSIPNAFTPNGDGINDTWVIKDLEYYHGLTVNVFNRWGQKLLSSVGYAVPWDGRYNGEPLPSGTYYYIIDPKNGQKAISGWVAIIR